MSITAIIPARGGSKGIPRKNLVNVCGKPLICWSIEQALAAESVGRVIVATDCDEIAEVSQAAGADVFHRSAESATDDAPSEVALKEVILACDLFDAEAVLFLQATSPCRIHGEIDRAIDTHRRTGMAVFSARKIEGYIWSFATAAECKRDGDPRLPRQKLQRMNVEENGSIYVCSPKRICITGERMGEMAVPHLMHPLDSFQIDEPKDIPLLELCMEVRLGCHATA